MCCYSIPFHGYDKVQAAFTGENAAALELSGGISPLISIVPLDIVSLSVTEPV